MLNTAHCKILRLSQVNERLSERNTTVTETDFMMQFCLIKVIWLGRHNCFLHCVNMPCLYVNVWLTQKNKTKSPLVISFKAADAFQRVCSWTNEKNLSKNKKKEKKCHAKSPFCMNTWKIKWTFSVCMAQFFELTCYIFPFAGRLIEHLFS